MAAATVAPSSAAELEPRAHLRAVGVPVRADTTRLPLARRVPRRLARLYPRSGGLVRRSAATGQWPFTLTLAAKRNAGSPERNFPPRDRHELPRHDGFPPPSSAPPSPFGLHFSDSPRKNSFRCIRRPPPTSPPNCCARSAMLDMPAGRRLLQLLFRKNPRAVGPSASSILLARYCLRGAAPRLLFQHLAQTAAAGAAGARRAIPRLAGQRDADRGCIGHHEPVC